MRRWRSEDPTGSVYGESEAPTICREFSSMSLTKGIEQSSIQELKDWSSQYEFFIQDPTPSTSTVTTKKRTMNRSTTNISKAPKLDETLATSTTRINMSSSSTQPLPSTSQLPSTSNLLDLPSNSVPKPFVLEKREKMGLIERIANRFLPNKSYKVVKAKQEKEQAKKIKKLEKSQPSITKTSDEAQTIWTKLLPSPQPQPTTPPTVFDYMARKMIPASLEHDCHQSPNDPEFTNKTLYRSIEKIWLTLHMLRGNLPEVYFPFTCRELHTLIQVLRIVENVPNILPLAHAPQFFVDKVLGLMKTSQVNAIPPDLVPDDLVKLNRLVQASKPERSFTNLGLSQMISSWCQHFDQCSHMNTSYYTDEQVLRSDLRSKMLKGSQLKKGKDMKKFCNPVVYYDNWFTFFQPFALSAQFIQTLDIPLETIREIEEKLKLREVEFTEYNPDEKPVEYLLNYKINETARYHILAEFFTSPRNPSRIEQGLLPIDVDYIIKSSVRNCRDLSTLSEVNLVKKSTEKTKMYNDEEHEEMVEMVTKLPELHGPGGQLSLKPPGDSDVPEDPGPSSSAAVRSEFPSFDFQRDSETVRKAVKNIPKTMFKQKYANSSPSDSAGSNSNGCDDGEHMEEDQFDEDEEIEGEASELW